MEKEKYPIGTCGKVSFPSRRIAKEIINFIKITKKGKNKIPKRVYFCRDCKFWHLTSKKKKTRNKKSPF